MNFPNDVELIICRFCHEINMSEIKTEFLKNHKFSFIYLMKWKGNNYTEKDYYEDIESINKNISCLYLRKKLLKKLEIFIEDI